MADTKERIAFLRGFYDARDQMPQPSVDYGGDPVLHAAWTAGQQHFDNLIRNEANRLEAASNTGNGFPMW